MIYENDCGFYIKHIHDVLERDSNNALRKEGLTMAQVTVLLQLNSVPEKELPLKELEKRLCVAQSTASGIIARLEQKAFVESFGSPDDKRIKMVRITPSGINCCHAAEQQMREAEENLLSSLTETEREFFHTLLKKVSSSMK
ncbi:MarR family winged helix-turn-helix transcriptional regulator [Butyricicoccus sp.]|uniref:MarR family winged helix-turn-helix transcriptional regulator n=1 Tax=Butyricicoccus sp. TaxID=2049021 RepID=UPI003F14C4BB